MIKHYKKININKNLHRDELNKILLDHILTYKLRIKYKLRFMGELMTTKWDI